MKYLTLGDSDVSVSNIALGCMRIESRDQADAEQVIQTALAAGINFFDLADIYGEQLGGAETYFGQLIKSLGIARDQIVIQSKVGIRGPFNNGITVEYYDFSKEHIINSVEASLKRLGTDYLDVLLLHRNDALGEPEEVAEAFDKLYRAGKVRAFGVSNHTPYQVELLKRYVNQKLVVNQMEFSAAHTQMLDFGLNVNRANRESVDRDGGILDYLRLQDMTLQTWSPVNGVNGVFLTDPHYAKLNQTLTAVGEHYGLNRDATAIAWLLRHPVKMQVVLGTMTPARIQNYATASEVKLTRPEWYAIYRAAGNNLP